MLPMSRVRTGCTTAVVFWQALVLIFGLLQAPPAALAFAVREPTSLTSSSRSPDLSSLEPSWAFSFAWETRIRGLILLPRLPQRLSRPLKRELNRDRTFRYDGMALDRLVLDDYRLDQQETPAETRSYSWLFGNVLSEYASGAEQTFNVGLFGLDETLERGPPQGPREALVTNQVVSVEGAVDDLAQFLRTTEYNAYGLTLVGADPGQVGFAGARRDPGTGLVYLRNRWYDPQLERFLSRDPIGFGGGWNFYEYAGSNPVMWRDPMGLLFGIDDAILIAAGVSLLNLYLNRNTLGASLGELAGYIDKSFSRADVERDCDVVTQEATEYGLMAALDAANIVGIGASLWDAFGGLGEIVPGSLADATPGSNAALVQEIASRAEAWGARQGLPPAGSGPLQGTLKHDYAARLLERYQSIFGNRGLLTERSWSNRLFAKYGTKGSVRLDVFDINTGVVYDYKFTLRPWLSRSRIQKILSNGPPGITNVVPVGP
jgi:RHS repeat-associated protein